MTQLMIDIECLATTYDAAVIQIGWCRFEPLANIVFPPECHTIHLSSALKYGRVDAKTLKWWMRQSDEARALFTHSGIPLTSALGKLAAAAHVASEIWACPPQFDLSILKNAYYVASGTTQPWRHRKERCFRTLCDIAGYNRRTSPHKPAVRHNAGADAHAQALQCIDALHLLRNSKSAGSRALAEAAHETLELDKDSTS